MAMSSKQESDINHSLAEHHKSWKSRLHRFQSSLRRSVRPRKGSRQRPTTEDAENRLIPAKENENHRLINRSFSKDRPDRLHARREISSHDKHTALSTKQDNGPKTSTHNNCVNGKTPVDRWSLDKRKFERSKPTCNNNSTEKQNLKDRSPNAHSSELSDISQSTSNGKKRRQKVKLQRVNVNTERTSISKSKSLSILTNLFKRSSLSKEKNNRGKSLSNCTSQSTASKSLSTAVSTDFDTLAAGDLVLSSSSIDSFTDCDRKLKRIDKYYSLKRSRGALIFPKNNLSRAFSLDTSLDPDNQPMEKSRTLAAIPPCIRVEEFRDNCGFWERSLTAEFFHGSSGSVTIDAGTEYYQRLTASSSPLIPVSESEVNLKSSSGGPENGENEISSITASNITQEAEKSNGMLRRQTAPPSLSFYSDQTSANGDIGGPSFPQGEGYIVTQEDGHPLAVNIRKSDSKGSVNNVSSAKTSEQKHFVDFKSDMGNNVSHAETARKAVLGEAKLIRHKKKHSQYSTENCSYGEASPIVLEGDFLECFEREIGDEEFNYRLEERKDACCSNGRTIIEKSSSLCAANEPLADSEKMINGDQENYSVRNWSDVKPEIGDYNKGEVNADKECIFNGAKHFSNGKVNTLQKGCDVDFCSETFEQTEQNECMRESDCLHCTTTRREMTDTELMERPSELSELSLSKKTDLGSLNELLHEDHVNHELITSGLPEIHNGKQGLAEESSQSPKVNSLPNSPFSSSTPAQAFHNSYPDIATMHLSQHSNDSSKSFSSSYHQVENSLESSCSLDSREMSTKSPLSLDLSKCKRNGEMSWSHLSPETTEERLRSCSTGIPSRSPLHQVLLTENRSASCTQLDQKEEDNLICSSPPYVRPRILSLEELPPCTAEVVLRKKRNIIKKNRIKHAASLPFVDHILDDVVDKGKRHSYGGYGDILFLQLPHLLQRSMSAEGPLDSCNSSIQSINSVSSLTESELGSTMSVTSDLSTTSALDKNLGRSRSVPGHLGITDIPKTSPIPEEQSSVTESQSNSIQDSDDEDDLGEMDVPEAFAEALWDHVTMDPEELSFQAGDIITVLAMTSCEWWFGQVKDRVGWFPAPFVRVRVSQTLAADETKLAPLVRTRKGTCEGFLSDAVVRSRVVEEILNTERDYVKNLKDVVEGYLKQARRRTDMFTEDQITTIFSNIEQIYHFHQEILEQLEECYVKEDPFASEIGVVFLKNKHGFEIYSEYCNNHPHAMAELKTLCESNKYKQFFEACRLLQEMINISLDGFLLTPVQKICKYPLQLAELKKHTKPNHKDFQSVKHALDTMREVASLINERKRKVESIHKIAKWQSTIEGWEGEDVLERSSELIHSGDVVKVSNGSSQDRVMFLFDHQLIFCKKDILKKNGLTYKGRIFVDDCTVQEDNNEKSTLQNTWKIYNRRKERWYIFHTKKVDDKELWLSAFQEERQRVSEDARSGLIISQKTRKAAMRAAQSSVKNKKLNGKKDKLQKSQSTVEIKPPPSPTLKLPEPVSSADLREEDEEEEEKDALGLRSSVVRSSFGLRGSTKKNREKRKSSFF